MRRWIVASLVVAGLLFSLSGSRPAWGQGGTLMATIGQPLKPATPAKPLVDVLYINGVRIQGVVTNLAAQMPGETAQAAAMRKAMAEVAAINMAITAAITAGTLSMGTPLATISGVQPDTLVIRDANGKPIINPVTGRPSVRPNNLRGLPILTLTGVTLVGDPQGFKPGAGQQLASNPTGEIGTAKIAFPPGTGGTGVKGGMTSTSPGMAVGGGSSVSFGLLDDQGQDATCAPALPPTSSCPGDFIATVFPTVGETAAQVLGDLATLFDNLFSSDGLTATFDPFADSLSLDQPLTPFESLFTQNTDSGLELDPFLAPVPEPPTFLLLGIGLAGLAGMRLSPKVRTDAPYSSCPSTEPTDEAWLDALGEALAAVPIFPPRPT
jgi:hypothetical protein